MIKYLITGLFPGLTPTDKLPQTVIFFSVQTIKFKDPNPKAADNNHPAGKLQETLKTTTSNKGFLPMSLHS